LLQAVADVATVPKHCCQKLLLFLQILRCTAGCPEHTRE
jgi:hypothetical protein